MLRCEPAEFNGHCWHQTPAKGTNIQKVTQKAADIRSLRRPEPYKGKGILYRNEVILRKEGKKLS